MTYATLNMIKAQLPFELTANSLPTEDKAIIIQDTIYDFIRSYTGTGLTSDSGLAVVEVQLTVQAIINIHKAEIQPLVPSLSPEVRMLLDNHISKKSVSFNHFSYGGRAW